MSQNSNIVTREVVFTLGEYITVLEALIYYRDMAFFDVKNFDNEINKLEKLISKLKN